MATLALTGVSAARSYTLRDGVPARWSGPPPPSRAPSARNHAQSAPPPDCQSGSPTLVAHLRRVFRDGVCKVSPIVGQIRATQATWQMSLRKVANAPAGVSPAPTVNAALRCRARSLNTGLPCQRVLIVASRANGQGSPLPEHSCRRCAPPFIGRVEVC
jgi:hypothetical protein